MSDSSARSSGDANLLLVEDNPGDVRLVEEAFRDDERCTIYIVSDGDDALDFLYQRGEYETAPRPDLVLLDWNVPRTSGKEVLTRLKGDPDLKSIPVTVLTGSQDDGDVRRSYRNHANACLRKAVEPDAFMQTLRTYREFWLSTAKLPVKDDE
ncbi:response regulator [Natronolimnohabitans innermongolicus]|uniref:Response regulator receiver protein n=1 Tax=Natronolimnohabitans innermongolicus JCM 12255 TaxID=1227499 RepID=L9X7U0_9EURY|nr:response regulator [Natronolimnohabitans innermongolicus]ELY57481.1 response regulator receiver protein [Natronolimnohabitans innermongolicus JCM 12255]